MIAKTVSVSDIEWAQNSLPWCHVQPLPDGRVLGSGMRGELIDRRVAMLQKRMQLSGKTVLEPGCCEGHITTGLCQLGARVTAFDARLPNATKTFVRTTLAGHSPRILISNADDICGFGKFDVVMHCGLLYHLTDPFTHLQKLAKITKMVLLDTHVAYREDELTIHDDCVGHWWDEAEDLWSGMQPRSFWMTLESLESSAREAGFGRISLLDWNDDANGCGPRGVWLLRA